MKKIFTYFGIFLSVVLMGALSSCKMQELDPGSDAGLGIKVFSPAKVVPGQPMTINGTGLGDVKEIVFPDDVSVTNFELVSNEMIRVIAPKGISAEGGKLILRTDNDQVESRLPLTLGSTAVSGFSKQPGEDAEGGEQITIFGKDLEFINAVELLGADGEPNLISHNDFYRKGTNNVIFTIPEKDIYTGAFVGKVYTYDGKSFDMPELNFKPGGGGRWEIKKVIIWENGGTVTDPASWDAKYRYALEGHDGNKEAVAEITQENWDAIKTGTFYLTIQPAAEWYQVRVVTGWWKAQWPDADDGGAFDFNPNSPEWIANDDGTFTLPITFGEHAIVGLLDEQHLLFTGGGFIVENLYYEKEEWIPGDGHWETVKKPYWENDGSGGPVSWSGTYRFALDGHDGNNECIATFPQEVWDKFKTETFYLDVEATDPQVRVTNGYWDASWKVGDIQPGNERITDNGDGTWTVEINLSDDADFLATIDEKHLLFTGDRFTPLMIYVFEDVWVAGGGEEPKEEVVLWEGEAIADDWGNQPNLLSDAGVELQAAGAQPGQEVRFYITPTDSFWQLEIVEGHWSGVTYAAYCSPGADDGGRFTEWDLDANGGYVPLTITQEMLDAAYVQQWWGGTFIGNGDNVKITKITLY